MAKKGTLTVRVVSDTKAAEKGLDRFNTQVENTGDKLQAAGKKMTLFATVPVAAAMGVATKAASDLQQAVGGTEAVFGDAADSINDFAKEAARASGLSEREFREATTSIGGQLKRMTGDVDLAAEQSMELTKVAADLAATYGGTTAEAVQALGSAFRGEADPAERFNLNLKIGAVNAKAVEMGLAATTSEVDDNARAQATLALIMEQSADAQGQFARESDSAAGSMQIAKAEMENASAEIGSHLLPLVADLAGGVADLAGKFGSLPDPIQKSVLGLAGIIATAGPITSAVGGVITGIDKMKGAASKAGDAFETLQLKSLYLNQGFGGPAGLVAGLGAVGAVVATGAALYGDYADTKAEARRITDLYVDALKAENDELDENVDKVGAAELANKDYATAIRESGVGFDALISGVREAGDALESLDDDLPAIASGLLSIDDALERAGLSGTDLGDALGTLQGKLSAGEFNDLLADLDGLADRYDNATVKTKNQTAAAKDVTDATGDAADAADDAIAPTEGLGGAADEAADAQDRLSESIKDTADALRASIDPLFAARDALNGHRDAQDDLKDAEKEYLDRTTEMNTAIETHGRKSDEATAAWVRQTEALAAVKEAEDAVVESALDVSIATAELTAKMEAGEVKIADAEAQLRTWVDQGLITEQQAYDTAEELRGVASAAEQVDGRDVAMQVRLEGFAEVIAQLDEIARRTGADLLTNASVAARDRATPGAVTATTTPVVNNVTINYPAPEPTSESLPRVLRKLQYGGAN